MLFLFFENFFLGGAGLSQHFGTMDRNAAVDKVKYDHRSKFSNLSNWKEEA